MTDVKPIDLLNPKASRATKEVAYNRYDICKDCDRLHSVTKTCSECGCFMRLKVTLSDAYCPLGKWNAENKNEKVD